MISSFVRARALGTAANTDSKLLIYGLFQRAEFWHRTGMSLSSLSARPYAIFFFADHNGPCSRSLSSGTSVAKRPGQPPKLLGAVLGL